MRPTQSAAESTMLKNLSRSWSKIANQTDRYTDLIDEKDRAARK
jgi:hypothetical protein